MCCNLHPVNFKICTLFITDEELELQTASFVIQPIIFRFLLSSKDASFLHYPCQSMMIIFLNVQNHNPSAFSLLTRINQPPQT